MVPILFSIMDSFMYPHMKVSYKVLLYALVGFLSGGYMKLYSLLYRGDAMNHVNTPTSQLDKHSSQVYSKIYQCIEHNFL